MWARIAVFLALFILAALSQTARAAQITVEQSPPSKLVFVSGNDLWILEAHSSAPRRLESNHWISPSSPHFTDSSGDTILFSAHKRERFGPHRGEINIDKADLYLAALGRSNDSVTALTDAGDLSIAPDAARAGKDIVFVANRHSRMRGLMPGTNSMELYLLSSPWKMPARLTQDGGSKYNPRWSPDGSTVAYLWMMSHRFAGDRLAGDSTGLYVLDAGKKSARPRRIASAGDYPTWSRDGSMLAYASRGKLFVITVDDETSQSKPLLPVEFKGYASFPRWTAHGILFQWAKDSRQGIALLDPSTGAIEQIVSGDGEFGGADLAR